MTQVIRAAASAEAQVMEGGVGRQTIYGGAGDDLIYADMSGVTDTNHLRILGAARDAEFGALTSPGGATFAEIDGRMVFFGADDDLGAGGVAAWTVGAEGELEAVWSQSAQYWLQPLLTGVRDVQALRHDGAAWLVTGGWGVSLSRIDDLGRPQLMDTLWASGDDGLSRPGAFSGWSENGRLTVLVGGGGEGGLSRYEWTGAQLQLRERIEDDPDTRLGVVSAVETVKIGAARYVLTLSSEDSGLTVWKVGAAGLTETDRRSPDDAETRFSLSGSTSLAVVEQIGQALVFAATDRGTLVSFRLDASGRLEKLQTLTGFTEIAHARIGAEDLIFAAGENGVVQLFEIGADGALNDAGSLQLGESARIGALTAATFDETVLLMAARPDQGGFDLIEIAQDGADFVYGGGGNDRMYGGGGADRMFGQAGADRLFGDAGDDLLVGGGDDDLLVGGDGNDELRGGGDDDQLEGHDGDDMLKGGAGRDYLQGGNGDDELRGGMLADELSGQAGDDIIKCGFGHDLAGGGAGNDVIYGHWGRDTLYGGGGNDWIGGGNGDDFISGQGDDDILKGALGRDKIYGDAGNDRLHGGGHRDQLWGGNNDDFLFGDDGADQLWGGHGADHLDGGRGSDWLEGGIHNDVLTGGGGADTFAYRGLDWGRDVITDFKSGLDRIRFDDGPEGLDGLRIEDGAEGVRIHMGDPLLTSITLQGVEAEDLSSSDFLFMG